MFRSKFLIEDFRRGRRQMRREEGEGGQTREEEKKGGEGREKGEGGGGARREDGQRWRGEGKTVGG
ncbi:hypothetical protein LINPERPRIM_LOCUS24088, partial [Linum perenne]